MQPPEAHSTIGMSDRWAVATSSSRRSTYVPICVPNRKSPIEGGVRIDG
jgi:hypothetical protein